MAGSARHLLGTRVCEERARPPLPGCARQHRYWLHLAAAVKVLGEVAAAAAAALGPSGSWWARHRRVLQNAATKVPGTLARTRGRASRPGPAIVGHWMSAFGAARSGEERRGAFGSLARIRSGQDAKRHSSTAARQVSLLVLERSEREGGTAQHSTAQHHDAQPSTEQLPSTAVAAPSTEHRAPSTEHRAPSTEHQLYASSA